MSPRIEFYMHEASPPCRAIIMLGEALKIDFNIKHVDVVNGGTKNPEFVKMSPQHAIPVICDKGFVLTESRAIMEYLCEAYSKNIAGYDSAPLYPKSLEQRATVNSRLYFDATTLYPRILMTYIIPLMRGGEITQNNKDLLQDSLNVLDTLLQGHRWVAKTLNYTIADISIVTSVSTLEAFGHSLDKFSNVRKWLLDCQRTIPGYQENLKGVRIMGEFFRSKFPNYQ